VIALFIYKKERFCTSATAFLIRAKSTKANILRMRDYPLLFVGMDTHKGLTEVAYSLDGRKNEIVS
jgi:hypothetical protein